MDQLKDATNTSEGTLTLYSDGDVDTNRSGNPTLAFMIEKRVSRRATMLGGGQAAGVAVFGTTLLAACGGDDAPIASIDDDVAAGTIVTTAGSMVTLTPVGLNVAQTRGEPVSFLAAEGAPSSFIAPAVTESTEFRFNVRENGRIAERTVQVRPASLNFDPVEKNFSDFVTVPSGYTVTVLTALGDPILPGVPAFRNDGTDTNYAGRIGDHGDALYYFGLNPNGQRNDNSSSYGILAQNHENLSVQYLHPAGPTTSAAGNRPEGEAIKEIEAHGVSFTEIRDETRGAAAGERLRRVADWKYVQGGRFNRRVTPNTPTQIYGPARGSDLLKTKFSPAGTEGRGTINNCANGYTEWGTLLTCEENWAGYFRRRGDEAFRTPRQLAGLLRYGVSSSTGNYGWASVQASSLPQDLFSKWDARATSSDPAGSLTDYRNEPNQFGWVVEIDPYDPSAAPRKRTALGRMAHEGAWLGKVANNGRLAVYMGDDSRNEYFYKFVSDTAWSARDASATERLAIGDKYLDSGTLYVAKFDESGTGTWLPLVHGQVPDLPNYAFADQADVLVHTRLAADAVGATTMDRPEWTACNPVTGEIYLTLTNNRASNRPISKVNAANPRFYADAPASNYGNPNGHIIRIRETGDDPASTSFTWDIYLFGADAADSEQGVDRNISRLSTDNDFSSPDGLWFSRPQNPAGRGTPLAWIQTDDSSIDDRTNDQMLAALPGSVGDGGTMMVRGADGSGGTSLQQTQVGTRATLANLRRFLVGPKECEITGVDTTPDGRVLFVGIQHPGEDGAFDAPSSNWPQSENGDPTGRPRSGVVAITRNNGGIVGL